MNKNELQHEGIRKEESVGFLRNSINLIQAELYLTPRRLVLELDESNFGFLGNLFRFGTKGFNLFLKDIKSVRQGKNGLQRNILEITDKANRTYRLMVQRYQEWEQAIRKLQGAN